MSFVSFRRTSRHELKNKEIENGQLIFTIDNRRIYLDIDNNRTLFSDIVFCDTIEEMKSEGNPSVNLIYIVGNNLFKWNGVEYISLNVSKTIIDIVGNGIRTDFIVSHGKNDKYINVEVFDSNNNKVYPDIIYIDKNNISIKYLYPLENSLLHYVVIT